MVEDYIDDYIITIDLDPKKDPTPVGTGTNLPYIGKCVDYYSWLKCAKLCAQISTLYPGDGALFPCMVGGIPTLSPFLIDNFGQDIMNSTPNAGNFTAVTNQLHIFFHDMWSNPGNGLGYLDQANTCCPPNVGLPYHSGCASFDLKINQWLNIQSGIPGHVASPPPPLATPPGSNTLAASMTSFTNALPGTNEHYKWWRTFYKIRWAEDMQKCCECGEWYNPTQGKRAAPAKPVDSETPISETPISETPISEPPTSEQY